MNKSGLTLLETLLVVALLALLTVTVIPNIQTVFRASVQASVRRFSALVRYSYDQAILTGKIHRIVLDLDKQEWFVEIGGADTLPVSTNEEDRNDSDYDYKPKSPAFDRIEKADTQHLPKGVLIARASSWRLGKDVQIDKGQVAIYAFPSGLMDEAGVWLKEQTSTQIFHVSVNPLTGRVDVEAIDEKPTP